MESLPGALKDFQNFAGRSFDDSYRTGVSIMNIFRDHEKVSSPYLKQAEDAFSGILFRMLSSSSSSAFKIQSIAFEFLLGLARIKARKGGEFPFQFYHEIFKHLLPLDDKFLLSVGEKYLHCYTDLRYYFYLICKNVLEKDPSDRIVENVYFLLRQSGPAVVDNAASFYMDVMMLKGEKTAAVSNIKFHKNAFGHVWIKILAYPQVLGKTRIKDLLTIMDSVIIPSCSNPKLLFDFLKGCYDYEGAIRILSLKSLFLLITSHNLDYPDFFLQLYAMFDADLLHSKYRNLFFKILPDFLSSPLVPNYVVASCVKRLARLCLFAPPASILWVMPFIYNVIQKHSICKEMIHRNLVSTVANDPFCMALGNPKESRALQSSLWELDQLACHYCPEVSSLSKMFKERMNKPFYDLNDFIDYSYLQLSEKFSFHTASALASSLMTE